MAAHVSYSDVTKYGVEGDPLLSDMDACYRVFCERVYGRGAAVRNVKEVQAVLLTIYGSLVNNTNSMNPDIWTLSDLKKWALNSKIVKPFGGKGSMEMNYSYYLHAGLWT